MTISQTQLVDILYKKLSGVSKTDTSTAKGPANESNASPQLTPGSVIWQQDYLIPSVTTLPSSNSSVVTVYSGSTSSIVQAVSLSESVTNETWTTGLTNWISPQFGAGYQLKLYAGPPGATGTTPLNYTNLPVGGSGNSDSWYFDYMAGIVNFADTNVPTAAANVSNVVYVVGARYTGTLGITSFGNLTIGNISINGNTITGNTSGISFASNVYVGNIFYSNGQPFVSSSYGNAQVLANLAANTAANITVYGNVTATNFVGNAYYLTGLPAGYANSNVASYLLTNTGNIAAGNVAVTGTSYGNIAADVITPYQTPVTVFNTTTALGLPVGSNVQYPASNSAGYIRYNSSISSVEFYNGSGWVPVVNSITDQQIVPSGSTASFTLNKAATAAGILVSINGTMQTPGVAYTVSGTTITFAEIPTVNDIIDVRFIASAVSTNLEYEVVDTGNVTVGTTLTIIDSFDSGIYRSAKYLISSTSPYDSQYAEVGLTQFGSNAATTAYAILNTGANTVVFSANINGSTVNLLAQGTTAANQLRIQRSYFLV
jgi:hypothetical protein